MCLYEKPYIQPVVDLVEKWKICLAGLTDLRRISKNLRPFGGKEKVIYAVDVLGT